MRISIDKNIPTPIYIQIKNEIREIIYSGILPKGFSLPAERKLAEELGVSRSTVIKAYEELKALGLLDSHMGKGTKVIIENDTKTLNNEKQILPLSWYQFFDSNIAPANDRTIIDIIDMIECKNTIYFSGGVADPELYPVEAINRLQEKLSKKSGKDMLNYSAVEGYYPLRESVSQLMKLRHISVSPKEIMILSGSMQGLDFVSRTFITPKDVVIVEEPTFMGALQLFKLSGAKVIGVPMDEEGIKTDILEVLLNKYKPKFIYTVPTFQNPSGTLMSLKRRYEFLELAYKYQVPIIEDDPYGELRYEGIPVPPLKALDQYGYVIYLSTFSKTLFSGMRVGWIAAPSPVIKKFSMIKQMTDLHTNAPSQYILDSFLREGLYVDHIKSICREYAHKRNVMAKALEKKKKSGMDFKIPQGGYYIWCKIPDGILQTQLLIKSSHKGIVYTPGNVFYPEESDGNNYIRLNFTFENTKNIYTGIQRLLEAVEETASEADFSLDYKKGLKKPMV